MKKVVPRLALLSALSLLPSLPARAQTFPFAMPWDDAAPTSTSLATLNPAPLGNTSRISVRDGHFVDASGRRVRFLGTNITSSAVFTRPEEAAPVAERLHKFGFNIVRLHHMDASWSNPSIFGFDHDAAAGPNQKVAPESLALLDNFVSEFKRNGIYVDLNLHVSRALSPGDGAPDTDKLPELGKVVAYFDPTFIAQQKDYARQILGHVNPATGLKWADDPVVALVELNNEDTLIGHAWDGSLPALPPHYREILSRGWNTFLKARYASDAALKQSWQGAASNVNLLTGPLESGWNLEQQAGAAGALSVEDGALKIGVTRLPDAEWKLQLNRPGLDLGEGEYYTVSFRARTGEGNREISSYLALDQAPWTQIGGSTRAALTPEWKTYRFVFRAQGTRPNHARMAFAFGNALGTVYLSDIQIAPGALADIAPDWTLGKANFDLPGATVSPGQARDWTDYLAAVERSYVETMTDCVKNEIGYRGLVTCSQASYGGPAGVARESRTDWTDMHAYWQHPNFPGQGWDANNWNITNTPMTDADNTGTLMDLAAYRVAGQPFTVSEYNHAAPNDYAAETVPMILGYAAAQDWDGVFLFSYNGDRDNWKTDRIANYFDVASDPNKMAMLPGLARAFLRGDVPALSATTTLTLPRETLLKLTAQAIGAGVYNSTLPNLWRRLGLTRADVLESRMQLQIAPTPDGEPQLKRAGKRGDAAWNWTWRGNRGIVTTDAPRIKSFVGRVGDSFVVGPLQAGALRVSEVQSSNQWAALSLVALDNKPISQSNSLLLSALNRAENTGMKWNAERTSVGNNWGQGPTQIEVPSAHIELQTNATRARVFRLTPSGSRGPIQNSQLKDGKLSFDIGPEDATPWWEIATD